MKYLFLFGFVMLFCSCKTIVNSVYGVNKNLAFKSLKDYEEYVRKKYEIEVKNLYYLDQNNYYGFLEQIIDNKIDYFLGIFLNDSSQIQKSDFLMQNESCGGRILKEIQSISDNPEGVSKIRNEVLKKYSFINMIEKTGLLFSNNGKKKIVLIFSYKAGLINKNDFVQIQNMINSTSGYELAIISIDKLYDLVI